MFCIEDAVLAKAKWLETDLWWIEGVETTKVINCMRCEVFAKVRVQPDGTIDYEVTPPERWDSAKLRTWCHSVAPHETKNRKVRFRLAICTGNMFLNPELRISKDDYEKLERGLGLHPSTLRTFTSRTGAFEQFSEHTSDPISGKRSQKLCRKLRCGLTGWYADANTSLHHETSKQVRNFQPRPVVRGRCRAWLGHGFPCWRGDWVSFEV